MDERIAKGIIRELRSKRADAALAMQYRGKWALYMLFRDGHSLLTPKDATVFDKSIVDRAIERFKAGNHQIFFPCGTKVTMEHLTLIMPMPVKG